MALCPACSSDREERRSLHPPKAALHEGHAGRRMVFTRRAESPPDAFERASGSRMVR